MKSLALLMMTIAVGTIACGRTAIDDEGQLYFADSTGGNFSQSAGGANSLPEAGFGNVSGWKSSVPSGGTGSAGGINAGGVSLAGKQSAFGGASAGAASGTGGIAQSGHGLTDVLPYLTASDPCDACVRKECPDAIVCSGDSACAIELTCLINGCRAKAAQSTVDTGLIESDASLCVTSLAGQCSLAIDVGACLGPTCVPASVPATLSGLNSVVCVYARCVTTCQIS